MTQYAIKATANNDLDVVEFDPTDSYNIIKESIGGGIFQCIYLPELNADMWIDDEGKLFSEPVINAFGSALWVNSYGMTDMFVGDIIITGGADSEGKTLGLTQEQVATIIKAANDVMLLAVGSATTVVE